MMRRTVGVAPGTTTIHLGQVEPGKHLVIANPWVGGQISLGLGEIPKARVRWDLILTIGGGSLIVALAAGLIASAFEREVGIRVA
jgi:hypothetical protein